MKGYTRGRQDIEQFIDIDEIDRKIIGLLIDDARKKLTDIAQICGISSTAVKNRIRKLKQKGIIVKYTWYVDWSFFGYNIPVTICVNLKPKKEKEVYQLLTKKVIIMSFEHFLGVNDLFIFALAKNNEELKELERNLRSQRGVNDVELNIWNRNKMKFKFGVSPKKRRQEGLDSTDIQIFRNLLENPKKSFLKLAKEIGIAPITAQKRYKKMEKIGVLKPSVVVDYSKIGYPLKACFRMITSNILNKDLIFEIVEKIPNIFLFAETIGPFDIVALGLFKDFDDIKKLTRKIRALRSVESVTVSITDEADFPFKREYNPSQIFALKNVENLKEGEKILAS
jgi:Lrp/AsnC family transcriptional regulator for asnA, asnC and gidA